ncbi:mRNA N(3)-methylcytidine methyltransferase METTL8 isoform X2 [Thalassophryne amazonica]|uniref:mRNA N(3)-methylcytidine methyltransferase METTL8 isoform X2 n=1 Tax=Thalassophryne amazonica TaxID=390379 RepID=UPI0014712FCA|nr:mRNA N(3)-methylcytidine methyltransferase METTL8 isoform X2 [Thalassophryne amazonica]
MHKLQSLFTAKLAKILHQLFVRLASSGGRPSAPLGSRILTNPDDIFKHNMWDHVQWTEEEKENACQKAQENSCVQIPLMEQSKFHTKGCQYWDRFYKMHHDKFFKNRKWLFLEFPELLPLGAHGQAMQGCYEEQEPGYPLSSSSGRKTDFMHDQHSRTTHHHRCPNASDCQLSCQGAVLRKNEATTESAFPGEHSSFRIFEVGCGVGNSVFPIVDSIKETDGFLYCCDFSSRAIQVVKEHPDYDHSVCHAFVHDICEQEASLPFPPESLDVILAVFVLSSIHPQRLQGVLNQLCTYLKHGGIFLFRDYGRYDCSQLRFKKGQCLSENFYVRGDGTCAYFFTKEVHDLFSNAGLQEIQNLEDKRLQVNRRKKLVMHRVWVQSKYRKL